MTDLFAIMSKLVTPQGEILIPGIKDLVAPLTDEERKRYDVMDFTLDDINGATGSKSTISDEKQATLMGRMRYPSLSLHGIEGAFADPGTKTVIPAKVIGKFSLRLVPNMTPDKTKELVVKFIQAEFAKRELPQCSFCQAHALRYIIVITRQLPLSRQQEHAQHLPRARRQTMARGPQPLGACTISLSLSLPRSLSFYFHLCYCD